MVWMRLAWRIDVYQCALDMLLAPSIAPALGTMTPHHRSCAPICVGS